MIVRDARTLHMIRATRVELVVLATFAVLSVLWDFYFPDLRFAIPVSALTFTGVAITFLVVFLSNRTYEKWWEARILWGRIVNDSRTLTMQVLGLVRNENLREGVDASRARERLIHRHIAWVHGLRSHLRRQPFAPEAAARLSSDELRSLADLANLPAHLLLGQSEEIAAIWKPGVEEGRYRVLLLETLGRLFDHQGGCERIKNTPFPGQYRTFTVLITWVYVFLLIDQVTNDVFTDGRYGYTIVVHALALVMGYVFLALEKLSAFLDDPFQNSAFDTPIATISRNIEIDVLQMMHSGQIPEPLPVSEGVQD